MMARFLEVESLSFDRTSRYQGEKILVNFTLCEQFHFKDFSLLDLLFGFIPTVANISVLPEAIFQMQGIGSHLTLKKNIHNPDQINIYEGDVFISETTLVDLIESWAQLNRMIKQTRCFYEIELDHFTPNAAALLRIISI